jgi:hypothetical protein
MCPFYLLKEPYVEHATVLLDSVEKTLKTKENKRCKLMDENVIEERMPDVLRSYRLLEHPSNAKACYLKFDDPLVNERCSKLNGRLYAGDSQRSIVKQVTKEYEKEPYSGVSLDSHICTIEFDENANREQKIAYASFLEDNDPKAAEFKQKSLSIDTLNKTLEQQVLQADQAKKNAEEEARNISQAVSSIQRDRLPSILAAQRQIQQEIDQLNQQADFFSRKPHILEEGGKLLPGQCLQGVSGHRFCFDTQGRVFYHHPDGRAIQDKGGSSHPKEFVLQNDGNLVAYDQFGRSFWATQTYAKRNRYDARKVSWEYSQRGPYRLIVQKDGDVVLYDADKKVLWRAKR